MVHPGRTACRARSLTAPPLLESHVTAATGTAVLADPGPGGLSTKRTERSEQHGSWRARLQSMLQSCRLASHTL